MKDIEWQAMWDWHRARLQERFGELEGFFRTGDYIREADRRWNLGWQIIYVSPG